MGGGANAGDFQVRAVDHGEKTTVFHILVPHQFEHGQEPGTRDYVINIAYQPNSPAGWDLEGENNEIHTNPPWSASADQQEPQLRHGNGPTVLEDAIRKFTVERMIESEGGAAVEEEDEHTVMFVVFTPGLLIRAHHSAAYTSSGGEIDRPEDEDLDYVALAPVPVEPVEPPMPPLDGSHSYVKLNLEFRPNSGEVDDGLITLTLPEHIRAWDEDLQPLPGSTIMQLGPDGGADVIAGPPGMSGLADAGGVDIWVQFDPDEIDQEPDITEEIELAYELNFAVGGQPAAVADALLMIPFEAVPDVNRDGRIDEQDRGLITEDNPFYFWVNDFDNLEEDPEFGDIPGTLDKSGMLAVHGYHDLLNYFALELRMRQLLEVFPAEDFEYVLTHDEGAIQFIEVPFIVPANGREEMGAGSYLGPTSVATAVIALEVKPTAGEGSALSEEYLAAVADEKGILLIEAVAETSMPVFLRLFRKDDDTEVLARPVLPKRPRRV